MKANLTLGLFVPALGGGAGTGLRRPRDPHQDDWVVVDGRLTVNTNNFKCFSIFLLNFQRLILGIF